HAPCDGSKHFGGPQDSSELRHEHHLDACGAIERLLDAAEAAGERNRIEHGGGTMTVGKPENRGNGWRRMQTRGAQPEIRLGEEVHCRNEYGPLVPYARDYRRACTSAGRGKVGNGNENLRKLRGRLAGDKPGGRVFRPSPRCYDENAARHSSV